MRQFLLLVSISSILSSTVLAAEELKGRAEVNWRMGHERSILMSEFWVPIAQDEDGVFYGDLRMMGDDQDSREGNLGIGYRQIKFLPFLDTKGVIGVHGWLDRRITKRGSTFHQVAAGAEWLGESMDLRLNGYLPLSNEKEYTIPNADPQGPALAGTGIVVDTNGRLLEEPQHGFDLELGWELGQHFDFVKDNTDSFRIYGGGYYFDGDNTERVTGWRTRFTADATENIQIGARFQRDDERGSQGFLEATFRFPFGHKKSYRREGLRARLDESPERDIDIVTGDVVTDTGNRVQVLNTDTGQPQQVLIVDNSSAPGGNGSVEHPFNTLAAAEAAATEQTIIYLKEGNGTSAGQNQGITLSKQGQQLIGSGVDFYLEASRYRTSNGLALDIPSFLIEPATSAPIIGSVNAGQDGITVSANDVMVAGVTVDNANTGRDGIVVRADGIASSARNITIRDVTAQNAHMGIYLHATNNGAVSAKVERSIVTSNSQHGIAVYDDTDGTFEVDLGGGALGSSGNNLLTGNGLEDLAVDYDGRTLSVRNNWWGQASGPDADTPDIGITPQIYYGAPINDSLVGHWTFDTEWTTDTAAYDRSGQGNNGTLQGGLSLASQVAGQNREALDFDGVDDIVVLNNAGEIINKTNFTLIAKVNTNSNGYIINTLSTYQSLRVRGDKAYIKYVPSVFPGDPSTIQLSSPENVNTGEWVQISSTWNNGSSELFVNENLRNADSDPTPNLREGLKTNLGGYIYGACPPNCTGFLNGKLDDIRIYNRALSASEIAELYRMDTSSIVDVGSFLTVAP